jgi:hypothetical protein
MGPLESALALFPDDFRAAIPAGIPGEAG